VGYPIFDLESHDKDVHVFLRKLEQAIILSLSQFGIKAFTRQKLTGVWVESKGEKKKIASIGIGVRRWVSYHGFALNLTTDLSYFHAISPCEQDGSIMTNLNCVVNELSIPMPTTKSIKKVWKIAYGLYLILTPPLAQLDLIG
jgi:lipoate-protein ligase B